MCVIVNAIVDLNSKAPEFPQIMKTGNEPKLAEQLRAVLRRKHYGLARRKRRWETSQKKPLRGNSNRTDYSTGV
jgi:hypothetical protein